jgi:hypothetical protein
MLKVNINQKEVNIENRPLFTNCGDLMRDISKIFLNDDIITKLTLNGKELTKEELQDYPLSDDKSSLLEIEAESLEKIKKRGFLLLEEYSDKIIPQIERASEILRIEDECEANQFYARCLEDLGLLIKLIEDVGTVSRFDFEKITFLDTPVKERIDRFSFIIKEMVSSQENDDWIMLADLLEYELVPLLEEWKEIVHFIINEY